MKTKITELLGIEYPIVQGAMAWIAEHHLAAAVSKAGGLGIIAGGAAPVDYIREEIHKARAITDKPLGMNIMLLSPNADDLAQLAIDEATRQGTSLYLFGEAEHPEVQGLVSYANGPCLVFGSLKELKEKQTFKDTHSEVSKPHRMQKAGKGAHQAGGPGKPHRTLSNWRYKIISI